MVIGAQNTATNDTAEVRSVARCWDHSHWSCHCCRKIEKSVQNLGNINLVITIRPDYRSICSLKSIFLSGHLLLFLELDKALLNLLAAAAENPQTISNFCTFVQYLITSPRQELCSVPGYTVMHSCCKIALHRTAWLSKPQCSRACRTNQ